MVADLQAEIEGLARPDTVAAPVWELRESDRVGMASEGQKIREYC